MTSALPISGRRLTTFVPGIGDVPSAPRRSFSLFTIPSRRANAAESSWNAFVPIKQEESERNWPSDSAVGEGEIPEEDGMPQDSHMKRELCPDLKGPPELRSSYLDHFSSLLASSDRSSRSDTYGSHRQDTSEGRWSRSEMTSLRSSDRSRSPRYRTISNHPSRRSNSMFYPDSRASIDNSSEIYVSNRSRSQRTSRDSAAEDSQRHPSLQQSLPPWSPSASPSLPASNPPSRSLSLARGMQMASSSAESSPPPEETEEEVDQRCRCPIGIMCPVRHSDHLDCRPLVRERKTWRERRDEEAFEQHKEAGSQGERFTTDLDLARVVNYFSDFLGANTPADRRTAVSEMRSWIMDMEDVTLTAGAQQTIAAQQVIPAITAFLGPANTSTRRTGNLPRYIEEELIFLERKWGRGDFSGNIKRGLTAVILKDVNQIPYGVRYQVDTNWPFYVSPNYFGQGVLVNGQVWESRAELQRDGVHAPPVAGISGTKKKGARSILLGAFDEKNNEGYADIDMGDIIECMGTALPDQDGLGPTNVKDLHMGIPNAWDPNNPGTPTAATQAMLKSLETKEPVRVIRSFAMCDIVTNKPIKGYRFDGMYRVIGATAMKQARQIWSFRLRREPEQLPAHGPLRGFRTPADQPDSSGQRTGHFHR